MKVKDHGLRGEQFNTKGEDLSRETHMPNI